MADKSKQHWQKVQERKRKEAERESAEIDSFIKMMDQYMSTNALIYQDCRGISIYGDLLRR